MDIEAQLYQQFGYHSFKPGQKEVIEGLLQGQETFAVLPTGTGKSLCYQLAGRLLQGTVIIVSPLLSLMEDQVQQLLRHGETKVLALNSTLSFFEKKEALQHLQEFNYIFVSPETLAQEEVIKKIGYLSIALFVIDEAHCVSQWGVDFRPEYTKLAKIKQTIGYPLTLALTATATPVVKKDILSQLFSKHEVKTVIYPVDRPNIALVVRKTEDKLTQLLNEVVTLKKSGIIYCATRKMTEQLSRIISERTQLTAAFYHGGLAANERSLLQQQFKANQLDVLCATNAFGMGIDKPDVRFVIHYDCPDSLENYVQEIGRAGRDGLPSIAILLYQKGDETIHYYFQKAMRQDRAILDESARLERLEVNQELSSFNEIQQKWLQGYFAEEYSLTQLREQLISKERDRTLQLQEMLAYIEENGCRRRFIQRYFADDLIEKRPLACCDSCGLSIDNYREQIVQSPGEKTKNENWHAILLRLFKE